MAEALDPAIPDDVEQLARAVLDRACGSDLRITTAESCTGGLLASLLTDIPGMSHAFERGFVTYTDASKRELLGVPGAMLERHGAVSEAVARAMADGALKGSNADVSISITGFTDGAPDGLEGQVWFGCASQDTPTRTRGERFGAVGRAAVRLGALRTALQLLLDALDAADRTPQKTIAAPQGAP